nr:putative ribonuclease H-like domain-containing protein [Tanacetum cinerariifolium]
MVQKPVWNNAIRVNHHNSARMSHSYSNRNVVPTVVLTRSRLVYLNTARPVSAVVPQTTMKSPRPVKHVVHKAHSPIRRLINHIPTTKPSNINKKVTTVKVTKDKGVIDSGCSRHMTGNISYLLDFKEFNGGYVAFGGNPKGGKISGKSKIKTECVVLSSDFKLPDENHVLLRVLRENNMYNVDLKNVVPSGDLTFLFAKTTLDESNLWHRRASKIEPLFCGMKGIKREFSVAITPQQNIVTERKNRTLIEAARTMLADLLLPIPFWVEAVNTACYVQNKALVTKPYNKTPYELLLGRTPSIGFMRPLGCPVTILNTLAPLGKFDGKADEGFLVGNSVNSKAFRIFNSRTRIVQETLHINFLENQPNVVRRNQPNHNAGIQENLDAGKVRKETVSAQQYVLLPLWSTGLKDPQNTDDASAFDAKENNHEVYVSPSRSDKTKKHDDKYKREEKGKSLIDLSIGVRDLRDEFEEFSVNSTNRVNAAGPNLTNSTNSFNTVSPSDTAVSPNFGIVGKSSFVDPSNYPNDPDMPALETLFIQMMKKMLFKMQKVWVLVDLPKGKRAIGSKWVFRNNKDERGIVTRNKARLVAQGHTQEEGIDYNEVFAPIARIKAIWLFLAYASFMGFMVYQMDVKSAFLYETIKEEVYVCQTLGFEDPDYPDKNGFQRGKIDQTLFIKKQKGDILLVQVYMDDIIFGSTNKELCKSFKKLMKGKFQISSMGELTFFLGLQVKQKDDGIFISQDKYVAKILRKFGFTDIKSASTPIEIEKPLLKDPDGEDVDVHIYSDYARASLDRKSTTEVLIEAQLHISNESPLLRVNIPRCDEDSIEFVELMENIDWNAVAEQIQEKHLNNIEKYQSLKRKPVSIAQAKKNMIVYLKNMVGYKMEHFKGMTYDKVRPIFEREYNKVQTLFKPDKDVEEPQKKRVTKEKLLHESLKKLKAVEVSVFVFKVEAIHVKYPLIDWEIHSEGSKFYWKIIRVGGIIEAYQSFEDMFKGFDREDLDALWRLVKEKFSTAVPTVDKEKALYVELKRLFEPDTDDVMWKLQRYMHYPLT